MGRITFEYRLYPNRKQEMRLQRSLNLSKKMYNELLEKAITTYKNEGRRLTKFDLCKYVKIIKDEEPEFKAVYSQTLQNCADRLSKAFDNFFRRVKENKEGKRQKPGFPRFKKTVKSITYPQDGFKLETNGRKMYISKIGNVHITLHRPIVGQIKTMTIIHRPSGKWSVQFSCIVAEDDSIKEQSMNVADIGLDVGIRHFITTSDGGHIDNIVMTDHERRKTRRLQRNIDRKQKDSHNREKARLKFARHIEWETNRRHDFLHKVSRELVSKYGTIVVESLEIKQMILVSPCPDAINKSSWGTLFRMIEYKAESAGTRVLSVDRYDPTSQICSRCHVKGTIERRQTVFRCEECGLTLDRDINAAKNILRIGLARAGHARSDAWGEGTSTSQVIEMRVSSVNPELYAGGPTPAEIPIS